MSSDFHLVIPCLRESSRIPTFLTALVEECQRLGDVNILVVDDGSGAEEVSRMERIIQSLQPSAQGPLRLLALPENIGKGGAIYEGWKHHSGEGWLMFVDADGSISASEVGRMIRHIRTESTSERAYFASRVKMLGRTVTRYFYRHLMGRFYATLVSEALDIPVYDSQCGCKAVPRAIYERAVPLLTLHGFAFDVDLLLALQHEGADVVEFPIDWAEVPGGKVRIIRDSFRMFRDVFQLRRIWPPGNRKGVLRH